MSPQDTKLRKMHRDFFFRDHWVRLPESWRNCLSEMSPNDLRWLIDSSESSVRQVLPLTLLSFRACTQTFSAKRHQFDHIESKWRKNFPKKQDRFIDDDSCDSGKEDSFKHKHTSEQASHATGLQDAVIEDEKGTPCSSALTLDENSENPASTILADTYSSMQETNELKNVSDRTEGSCFPKTIAVSSDYHRPVNEEGVLHYLYRKHVKPKKQHEILNLAKVIQLLSNHINCYHVVDVGGGLGHLSRLLSFGYGLKVTSVEASDGHAPKANKFDREIDKEIRKKQSQMDCKPLPTVSTSLPHHVTSRIYPNMTAHDFLAIIQAQGDTYKNNENIESDDCIADFSNKNQRYLYNTHTIKHVMLNDTDCEIASKVAKLENSAKSCRPHLSTCESSQDNKKVTYEEKVTKLEKFEAAQSETLADKVPLKIDNDVSFVKVDSDTYDDQMHDIQTVNCEGIDVNHFYDNTRYTEVKNQNENCSKLQKNVVTNKAETESKAEDFILTGLHACGDLTPTFLRFFVNCSMAKGLASVGCCYMKLTDESQLDCSPPTDISCLGYPMSSFVKSLPHHRLSYNSRELACHFADTYSARLKENPPHLKIHSYRAALEWVANQICPEFKRSAVQIPSKKTNKMDFESYARLGLVKLGISPDLLTPDLLRMAEAMVERWKDVVAFYTIRLSLAPVVETLVLLDRMVFLYEHGLSSVLTPIFDPNISPRNFALIAWK